MKKILGFLPPLIVLSAVIGLGMWKPKNNAVNIVKWVLLIGLIGWLVFVIAILNSLGSNSNTKSKEPPTKPKK